jgi:hypothetical protein
MLITIITPTVANSTINGVECHHGAERAGAPPIIKTVGIRSDCRDQIGRVYIPADRRFIHLIFKWDYYRRELATR